MKNLSLQLNGVIVADHEGEDGTIWITHSDCAEALIRDVNAAIASERLYIYGPAILDGPCASTNCIHR